MHLSMFPACWRDDKEAVSSDVTDDWDFIASCLALMCYDASQREHDLRELLRIAEGRMPESGQRAGRDGAERKKGVKIHVAVDTLGLCSRCASRTV